MESTPSTTPAGVTPKQEPTNLEQAIADFDLMRQGEANGAIELEHAWALLDVAARSLQHLAGQIVGFHAGEQAAVSEVLQDAYKVGFDGRYRAGLDMTGLPVPK